MIRKSILEQYTINLNEKAKLNQIDPVIGRSKELRNISSILLKRTKNNALLLGLPGVGKTAIAEELARSIVNKSCHYDLFDKEVLILDIVGIMGGTKERGQMETRVTGLIKEIIEKENVILMIDEIHMIVSKGDGSSRTNSNSLDIANMLKPGLARGAFHCIGATTFDEYVKFFSRDKALDRRFQQVVIREPSPTDTLEILKEIKYKYEEFHKCEISLESLESCVFLAERFISYRNFPDKAIDLLDEACSKLNIDERKHARDNRVLSKSDVEDIVIQFINAPLRLDNQVDKLITVEKKLKSKIVGQDMVIDSLIKTLKRHICGFYHSNRPIASMLLLGPTGTGKTETVNLLAEYYFGSRENIIRFDMSEFMEENTISTLIGSPPGYIGYEDGGKLTNAVKRNPYSIVLFDEIEKAHPRIYDILLQITEDGILSDNFGNTFCFKNTIIILTSNIGFTHRKKATLGFDTFSDTTVQCTYNIKDLMDELKHTFRPEFLNRLDNILPFDYLDPDQIKIISDKMIDDFIQTIFNERRIYVLITNETRQNIYTTGLDSNYGARPLRTALIKILINPLSEKILREGISQNEWVIF